MKPHVAAAAYAALFPELYLRFHRRHRRGPRPTAQSMAVLNHLALAGPLTITELARHLERAQSVVTEIVDQLARKDWLERMPDARDRRRHLVWLTEAGIALLDEERQVLSLERLTHAMSKLSVRDREALLSATRKLAEAAGSTDSPRRKR